MIRKAIPQPWSVPLVLLVGMVGGGCANQAKERIAILEETNANLTDQLNRSQMDLDDACRTRENLEQRLAAAIHDAEDLRAQLANVPAPETAAPGWTAVPGGAMIAIEGSVLFAPGRTVLRDESRRTLGRILSAVQGEYGDHNVFVFGHTDDQPIKKSGWTDNWQLSTERALAVVRHLRTQGVSADRLVACGCGEHRPRAANSSAANRAANRRVEIFAIDPQLLNTRP